MIIWKVTHTYKLIDHREYKDIGIYSSLENAQRAIEYLKTKEGFKDTPKCFSIKKRWRLIKPKLLDKTYWIDGYTTYSYEKNFNKNNFDQSSYK